MSAISSSGSPVTSTIARTMKPLKRGHVVSIWWPLAISWVMMAAGGPIIVPMVARMPDPEINLAALGGIVRALTFGIESPLIMILSASTALSKDWNSYKRLRLYTFVGIAIITCLHAVIVLTPVYHLVTTKLLSVPSEIIQPGRWGMMITIPYAGVVAYRRLNQGVLIRYGNTRVIALGTAIRVLSIVMVLVSIYRLSSISGVVAGSVAMTVGVTVEAIYVALIVRPVIRDNLRKAHSVGKPPGPGEFLRFYLPLAATSVALLAVQPFVSAAISRMQNPVISLAVWTPVIGFGFLLASGGLSMIEVVVALIDRPRALTTLRQFTIFIALASGLVSLAIAATPLGVLWFGNVLGLEGIMLVLAQKSFWLLVPYSAILTFQGFYQGILTSSHQTRRITESVASYALVCSVILIWGVFWSRIAGIYFGVGAVLFGTLVQTLWMHKRSIQVIESINVRGE